MKYLRDGDVFTIQTVEIPSEGRVQCWLIASIGGVFERTLLCDSAYPAMGCNLSFEVDELKGNYIDDSLGL